MANAKNKKFALKNLTEIKLFLLFILDYIRYPIDYTTLAKIIMSNATELTFDYEECLAELVVSEHVLMDAFDGERYYMISDSGRLVTAELHDTLDAEFRENSIRCAAKYVSLSKRGGRVETSVEKTGDKRYKVTLASYDNGGEVMKLSLTVTTKEEAELISRNFDAKPDGVYRGILFATSGKFEFFA